MLPLKGIKVLDLSRVLAGPYATQILGDLGADVIKIEEKIKGDETRAWTPPSFENQSAYYLTANRNKKSVALDFKNTKDLEKVLSLAAEADVLVENFKVGSLKKFGLNYESLSQKFPRLIYCSVTGFGQTGPRAHEPGYDVLIQGMGGLMSITGPDEKSPVKVGVAVTDLCTGLYAAIGILAALWEREKSGKGQAIDLALYDTQVSLLANVGMNFLTTGRSPVPIGNRHPTIVPYGAYAAADRPVMITIGNDHQFEIFSKTLGADWHSRSEFRTNPERVKNRKDLEYKIEEVMKAKPAIEWLQAFEGKGFPFGSIRNLQEVSEDPQTKARDLFTKMSDGKTPCIRSPLRFSRTPIVEYKCPPGLNQNAEEKFES